MTKRTTTADTPDAARQETLELISTRGVRAAAQAAIDICEDPAAPAPARATASGLLFRAAALGGFGKSEEEGGEKQLHEMTAGEIERELRKLRSARDDHETTDEVFD
jgi:hypothetical protein